MTNRPFRLFGFFAGLGKGSIGSIIFFSLRGLLGLSEFHAGVLLLLGTLLTMQEFAFAPSSMTFVVASIGTGVAAMRVMPSDQIDAIGIGTGKVGG